MKSETLSPELLHKIDAYWRAANYLSVGQIYLYDNPLLKRPLQLSDVKPIVVGQGTYSEIYPDISQDEAGMIPISPEPLSAFPMRQLIFYIDRPSVNII